MKRNICIYFYIPSYNVANEEMASLRNWETVCGTLSIFNIEEWHLNTIS